MDVRCVPRPGGGGCFAEAGGCSLHVLLPLPLRVISSSLPVPVPSAYPVSHPLKPTLPSFPHTLLLAHLLPFRVCNSTLSANYIQDPVCSGGQGGRQNGGEWATTGQARGG